MINPISPRARFLYTSNNSGFGEPLGLERSRPVADLMKRLERERFPALTGKNRDIKNILTVNESG